MENFRNKFTVAVLGVLWGAISGFLSVFDLQQFGMFVWPALVFSGCFMILGAILFKATWNQLALQTVFFLGIYMAVIFTLHTFALLMPTGAALVAVSLYYGFRLQHGFKFLLWGIFMQLIVGVLFDLFRVPLKTKTAFS
jgi:hypothetical protein